MIPCGVICPGFLLPEPTALRALLLVQVTYSSAKLHAPDLWLAGSLLPRGSPGEAGRGERNRDAFLFSSFCQ